MADSTAIFLDTQVFDAASFNFKTTVLVSVVEEAKKGTIRLVLTDITVQEVRARIEKNVTEEFGLLRKFKTKARVVRSSHLAEAKMALELDEKDVIADLHRQFEKFLKESNTEIIDTSEIPAGPVFKKYFVGDPPFGSGDKKSEFPDAFVVEALEVWAKTNRQTLYVVSGDEPIREACGGRERLYAETRLARLLNRIILEAAIATFLREQVMLRIDDIKESVKERFEDLMYNVDDQWGDAQMSSTALELKGEPEIIEADEATATIELRFEGTFDATLSYEDSSSGIYDSETKGMMFMDHKEETLEKEEEFVVEVKVTFATFDQEAFEIEEINLIEPDDSYSVSTSKSDG
jgi:hypothetical protein